MSGLDKNRQRNLTISFRVSQEEMRQLNARIQVCGVPKGEYIIQSILNNQISIASGKFQSDRLSLELRKLREAVEKIGGDTKKGNSLLLECKTLLCQLTNVI